jgi:hypothetical protein
MSGAGKRRSAHAGGQGGRSARARSYAGVGSRETPATVLARIRELARGYARAGWTLRTGGSPGADQAFLEGALGGGGAIELYLPWPGFEAGALAAAAGRARIVERPAPAAFALAARLHPRWPSLPEPERALLARDGHEVLGADLDDPAAVVICWTADGSLDGDGLLADGTGQALRVARAHGVASVNLHG